MVIEGELTVHLDCEGRHVRQVSVRSTRPMIAARVLTGRTAADAAATVPRLFSICSGAQGAAAVTALAAAGASGAAFESGNRECEVMLEALQDTFWHLLIDWPNTMGTAPCATPVATVRFQIAAAVRADDGTPRLNDAGAMRELGAGLSAVAAQAIFGMPPADWLKQDDVAALQAWCDSSGTVPAMLLGHVLSRLPALGHSVTPLLPPTQADSLLRTIVPALRHDSEFARAPTWDGSAAETGGLARMCNEPLVIALRERFGNAVVTRVIARMVELARLLLQLTASNGDTDTPPRILGLPLGSGEGLAAVETARGMLLHHARLDGQRVVEYQIVAPTEWNFHPAGALVSGLANLEADDEPQLIGLACLAAHALDPCVAFRIEADHA